MLLDNDDRKFSLTNLSSGFLFEIRSVQKRTPTEFMLLRYSSMSSLKDVYTQVHFDSILQAHSWRLCFSNSQSVIHSIKQFRLHTSIVQPGVFLGPVLFLHIPKPCDDLLILLCKRTFFFSN